MTTPEGGGLEPVAGCPEEVVQREVWAVYSGNCPVCQGPGPVDVHTSNRVYSLLFMSSWQERQRISSRCCGRKAKATDTLICLLFGWWGFPWGLIMPSIQVIRNLAGLGAAPVANGPSPLLVSMAREMFATDSTPHSREPTA